MKFKNIFGVFLIGIILAGCTTQSVQVIPETGSFFSEAPLSHDWKDINIMGGDVTKTFTLTNTAEKPILLTGAVTSCMCTTARITLRDGSTSPLFGMNGGGSWSSEIQPNESFDVAVIFDPLAHGPTATGQIHRTVNIISDPEPKTEGVAYTRIDVQANVVSASDYQKKDE